MVGARNGAGGGGTDEAGVVELEVAVVAFADDGGGKGVLEARADGAGTFVEVAWVLVEEGEGRMAEPMTREMTRSP